MSGYEWQPDRAIHDAESVAESEVTQDMIDFHILEWGVEMGGKLYMDGCSDAEFGECEICNAMDKQETAA